MKNICIAISLCFLSIGVKAQNDNPKYNAELAKKLEGDEYGMKGYIFVILKTGKNETQDKIIKDSCFRGHMANIEHMVKINKLIVAGPMEKNDKAYRGIFILNVADKEEAMALLSKDPAIEAGLLEPEYYTWYGSAALPEYLEASDQIWKKRH